MKFVKKNCHTIINIFIFPRRCVDIWHRGSPGGPRLTRRRPPGRDWAPRPALRWRRWWRGPRPPSPPSHRWSRSCTRFRSDCTDRERRVHLISALPTCLRDCLYELVESVHSEAPLPICIPGKDNFIIIRTIDGESSPCIYMGSDSHSCWRSVSALISCT